MRERIGNIWTAYDEIGNIIVVTCNNTLTSKNRLVMGAGIAKEAVTRCPELSRRMAEYGNSDYHFVLFPEFRIGCLQTKREWSENSPFDLVKQSVEKLREEALKYPSYIFNLPRPGCGLGRLKWINVKDICVQLPDNCVVWSKTA